MKDITYNRKEYVDYYSIMTDIEYSLLPDEVKMAYIDSEYGEDVLEARTREDKGNKVERHGYIKPMYDPYFQANGCTFNNYDFGVEEYVIRCVNHDKVYTVSEEAKRKLEYYFYVVANAKADAFESAVKRWYEEILESIETGDTVTFKTPNVKEMADFISKGDLTRKDQGFTDEEREMVIKAELSLVVESIMEGKSLDVVSTLPEKYKEVLQEVLDAENLSREDSKQLKITNPQENIAK